MVVTHAKNMTQWIPIIDEIKRYLNDPVEYGVIGWYETGVNKISTESLVRSIEIASNKSGEFHTDIRHARTTQEAVMHYKKADCYNDFSVRYTVLGNTNGLPSRWYIICEKV